MPAQQKNNLIQHDWDHIGAMSGPFLGHFRLYLIDSTKVISFQVAIDIVELYGDILQPGGQLETPGPVL